MPKGKCFDIASNFVKGVIEGGVFMTATIVPRKYSHALKTLNILNSRIQRARDSTVQSMRTLPQEYPALYKRGDRATLNPEEQGRRKPTSFPS
jgi:hypothetical protein